MIKNTPICLTNGKQGHTLHHSQVESPDGQWLVFDNRNDDSQLSSANTIAMVHTNTKEIRILYQTFSHHGFGPGVGAATFSPTSNQVLFIHGCRNATEDNPYSATRRTGVAINIEQPQQPIYKDARNIYFPYTKGALRGGTHSHAWKEDGMMLSFTYNDYVLEQAAKTKDHVRDQRVVGCAFPLPVIVADDDSEENNSGELFSVIVSKVVLSATWESDEIEKAFDECWVKSHNKIAFQGHVRNEKGELKTEIFIAHLSHNLSQEGEEPFEGNLTSLPGIPKGVYQERISFTTNGVSDFRHWLRSSPCGEFIYFLMEDNQLKTQLHQVNRFTKKITMLSTEVTSIHSPFNISEGGEYATYFRNDCLVVFDFFRQSERIIYNSNLNNNRLAGIPNWSKDSEYIYFNQYVVTDSGDKFLQIFKIKHTIHSEEN